MEQREACVRRRSEERSTAIGAATRHRSIKVSARSQYHSVERALVAVLRTLVETGAGRAHHREGEGGHIQLRLFVKFLEEEFSMLVWVNPVITWPKVVSGKEFQINPARLVVCVGNNDCTLVSPLKSYPC